MSVQVYSACVVLRWADPQYKQSYQLSIRFIITELILNGTKDPSRRKKKKDEEEETKKKHY
jgi:hypothetical protein